MANRTITTIQTSLALFQAYAEKAIASGEPPKGLEQMFAATLQVSPGMGSQIKSSRPIGDKLARQIEHHHGRRTVWLDERRESNSVAPAETAFLPLATFEWVWVRGIRREANANGGRSPAKRTIDAALTPPRWRQVECGVLAHST